MSVAPYEHGPFVTVPGGPDNGRDRAMPADLADVLLKARRHNAAAAPVPTAVLARPWPGPAPLLYTMA